VVSSIVLRLFRALLPLATLWVAKLILDAAVDWVTRGRGTLVGVWKLVALELGLAIASDVLGRANTLLDSLLGDRFTNRISVRLMEHSTALGASTQSAKEVKIFGLGRYLSQRYHEVLESIYIEKKELSIRRAIAGSALNVISTGGYYGAYAVVLLRYLAGGISVGNLTFLTGAFSRSRGYIERILSGFTDISDQAIFLKDLFEFFAMEPSIRSKPNAIPGPRPIREGFEFRNVAFAYPGTDRRVVNNLNFRLQPQEKVALIGENGAGRQPW
jgi:ABC-type multidrug transport system fused ATPase/permease subunit